MDALIGQIKIFTGNFAPKNWAFCNGQLLTISQNSALFSILGTTYGGDGRTTFGLPDLRGRLALHSGNITDSSSSSIVEKDEPSEKITDPSTSKLGEKTETSVTKNTGITSTRFTPPDLRRRITVSPVTETVTETAANNAPEFTSRRLGEKGGDETISLNVNNIPAHAHSVSAKIKVENGAPDETNPTGAYPAELTNNTQGYSSTNSGDFMTNDAVEITEQSDGSSQAHSNIQPYCCVNYIIALQGTFPSRN